jgi:hypothetical protein
MVIPVPLSAAATRTISVLPDPVISIIITYSAGHGPVIASITAY